MKSGLVVAPNQPPASKIGNTFGIVNQVLVQIHKQSAPTTTLSGGITSFDIPIVEILLSPFSLK
jgi:hypothetical protein